VINAAGTRGSRSQPTSTRPRSAWSAMSMARRRFTGYSSTMDGGSGRFICPSCLLRGMTARCSRQQRSRLADVDKPEWDPGPSQTRAKHR
jgi:hypothetical protein